MAKSHGKHVLIGVAYSGEGEECSIGSNQYGNYSKIYVDTADEASR